VRRTSLILILGDLDQLADRVREFGEQFVKRLGLNVQAIQLTMRDVPHASLAVVSDAHNKLRRFGHLYNASAIHAIATAPIRMTMVENVRSDMPLHTGS